MLGKIFAFKNKKLKFSEVSEFSNMLEDKKRKAGNAGK